MKVLKYMKACKISGDQLKKKPKKVMILKKLFMIMVNKQMTNKIRTRSTNVTNVNMKLVIQVTFTDTK